MINKKFNKRCLHMFTCLMSRCHDVTMSLFDVFHGLKECLPRVMEGISL